MKVYLLSDKMLEELSNSLEHKAFNNWHNANLERVDANDALREVRKEIAKRKNDKECRRKYVEARRGKP